MAVLTDLPVELLVCVFHYLESIDDVQYLGRVCKKTYGIISQRSSYLEIIRTVIQYAPQHRYDYQLCNVLRLHHNVVNDLERHYRTSLGVVPGTVPLYDFTSSWQQSLKSITSSCSDLAAWSDNAVCDVLARYQGIRILEDVWLERELSETDFVTVDGSSDAQQLEDRYFDLCDRNDQFADGELPPRNPQNPHTQSYIKFNSDQRGRFYAALVYVWLLSEIQWVSTQLVQLGSVSMSGLVRSLENCKNSMAKEQASPLLDELDRYAVFTFLYHHLFPLYAEFLADQDSSQLPLTFDSDFNNHGAHWMLQLVLMAGQVYLQPPDLIDLLMREKRDLETASINPLPGRRQLVRRVISAVFPDHVAVLPQCYMSFFDPFGETESSATANRATCIGQRTIQGRCRLYENVLVRTSDDGFRNARVSARRYEGGQNSFPQRVEAYAVEYLVVG
ncbi:hypothetical protein PTMSG1_02103 [Pyrenophora teres f. maculata]|nr:hypothetical protein PTMSG1_02103 [Pyrenophora teres f. maculata]